MKAKVKTKKKVEEELSEEAKEFLKLVKKKVPDIQDFTRLCRDVAWFDDKFGVENYFIADNFKQDFGLKTEKKIVGLIDKPMISCLLYNAKVNPENVVCGIIKEYAKKILANPEVTGIWFVVSLQKLKEVLSKYVKPKDLDKVIVEVKQCFANPLIVTFQELNKIMIVAPKMASDEIW